MTSEQVTHGNLPHWYKPGFAHFVTYRLADSIPAVRLNQWRSERNRLIRQSPRQGRSASEQRIRAHKLFFAWYDEHLDTHSEIRWLSQPIIAAMIRENLYHHHGKLYELLSWCLMPNHVHVLLQPFEYGDTPAVADATSFKESNFSDEIADSRSALSKIMHSLKSYTANQANQILDRTGRFWQKESYDHWVRDQRELQNIVDYIRLNPVRAGLCQLPHEYEFSSAFDRFQQDKSNCGLVGWLATR